MAALLLAFVGAGLVGYALACLRHMRLRRRCDRLRRRNAFLIRQLQLGGSLGAELDIGRGDDGVPLLHVIPGGRRR